jgi:hypothetical protein|tara:strand:+ start:211 stop:453 length:243 start_codon:yes stop_codon:yes gene_type:complete
MGFKGHAFKAGNIEIGKVNPNADLPLLSQEELIFLLNTLRDTTIQGADMEIAYCTTLKLQNIYTALEKKEEERVRKFSKK